MKRLILSCGMLTDELKKVCGETKELPEMEELPRGMHENPQKLRALLQERIAGAQEMDEIVLTYGLCGYGTVGLSSPHTRLVLPKFDDCISQLLYREAEGRTCRSKICPGHLYLTSGWIKDEKSVCGQCRTIKEQYGADAPEIINAIYGGYHTLDILETGAYPPEEVKADADEICRILHLKQERVQGSCDILKRIVTGNYDENFRILEAGETVTEQMFRFHGR